MAVTALEAAQVRRRLDPAALRFDTTPELPPPHGTIGRDRALEAPAPDGGRTSTAARHRA